MQCQVGPAQVLPAPQSLPARTIPSSTLRSSFTVFVISAYDWLYPPGTPHAFVLTINIHERTEKKAQLNGPEKQSKTDNSISVFLLSTNVHKEEVQRTVSY